jgi:hypothetical protein
MDRTPETTPETLEHTWLRYIFSKISKIPIYIYSTPTDVEEVQDQSDFISDLFSRRTDKSSRSIWFCRWSFLPPAPTGTTYTGENIVHVGSNFNQVGKKFVAYVGEEKCVNISGYKLKIFVAFALLFFERLCNSETLCTSKISSLTGTDKNTLHRW